jgi:hypothetical protein
MEGFKFAVYVFIPIGAVLYFQDPKVFRRIIESKNYIRYPPESDNNFEEDILINLKKGKATANSTATSSAPIFPRRYLLFGPRDNPEELKAKRERRSK